MTDCMDLYDARYDAILSSAELFRVCTINTGSRGLGNEGKGMAHRVVLRLKCWRG